MRRILDSAVRSLARAYIYITTLDGFILYVTTGHRTGAQIIYRMTEYLLSLIDLSASFLSGETDEGYISGVCVLVRYHFMD